MANLDQILDYTADALTPVKTTFTPTSGSAYASYGGCYYIVYGKFVHVHVGLSGVTANTGYTIYTLPEEVRPSSGICFGQGTGGTAVTNARLEVRSTGVVYVYTTGSYAGVDAYYCI